MKVLYLINGLGTGGSEHSLAEMLPGLRDAGIEVTVACLFRRGEGVQEAVIAAGFAVRFLRSRSLPGRVREVRRLLRALRPDLLHTTHFESDLAGRLAAWGTGVPVLSSLVVDRYHPARLEDPGLSRRKLAVVRALDGWTARHLTRHLHAVSEPVRQAALASLGVDPARVTVVERGRRQPQWEPSRHEARRRARRELGLDESAEVVLNTARQEYQKGQGALLAAVAAVATRRPRLALLIAGRRGHSSAMLATLAEQLRLGDRVRFLGHRDDVSDLLAAADIFAFPSLYEGSPGSLIEALAAGLPVVASAIPAHSTVLEHGRDALLTPPGDAGALAAALERLLADPAERARLAARSRELYAERFTLERAVAGMAALYRRVAAPPSAPAARGSHPAAPPAADG